MVKPPLSVAIAGLGTVGAGVVRLLRQNAGLHALRGGRELALAAVSARDRDRDRGIDLAGARWFADAAELAADPAIDVVVELIGGADGIARKVVETALAHGKPVVTANKALMAHHGSALARLAEANGASL